MDPRAIRLQLIVDGPAGGATILCNRTPAIVGNSSTDSSAAPTSAATMSVFIVFARRPISVMTTRIERDATDVESAKDKALLACDVLAVEQDRRPAHDKEKHQGCRHE